MRRLLTPGQEPRRQVLEVDHELGAEMGGHGLRVEFEVDHELGAEMGGHGLRVELHPPQRPRPVAQRHHDAVLGPRDWLERARQVLRHAQRVIAHGHEVLRDSFEQDITVMPHPCQVPVPGPRRRRHNRPLAGRDPLMPQADAEDRNA